MIGFESLSYLWAFFALFIPIAIHLWNKRKRKRIPVGSIRFFEKIPSRRVRSIALNDKRLLLLRLLLLLYLIGILVAPFVNRRSKSDTNTLLLIDAELLNNDEAEQLYHTHLAEGNTALAVELKTSWDAYLHQLKDINLYDHITIVSINQFNYFDFSPLYIRPHLSFVLYDKEEVRIQNYWQSQDSLYIIRDNIHETYFIDNQESYILRDDSLFYDEIFIGERYMMPLINLYYEQEETLIQRSAEAIGTMRGINFRLNPTEDDTEGLNFYLGLEKPDSGFHYAFIFDFDDEQLPAVTFYNEPANVGIILGIREMEQTNSLDYIPEIIWAGISKHLDFPVRSLQKTDESTVNRFYQNFRQKDFPEVLKAYALIPLLLVFFIITFLIERWWAHQIMAQKKE